MSVDLGKSSPLLQTPPPHAAHMQPHSIMGQPFIELRHRPPESRLRPPFGPQATAGFLPNQVPKSLESMNQETLGGTMGVENMLMRPGHGHMPLVRSLSQPAAHESFGVVATAAVHDDALAINEGGEEKMDPEDSAVKDLEDVEVKDLVDTDLENGEDLDLANDLHLEEIFMSSGKFDLIAYTDADLDLNEDLDLNDPIDDHAQSPDKSGEEPEEPPQDLEMEERQNPGPIKSEQEIKLEVENGCLQAPSCKNQTDPSRTSDAHPDAEPGSTPASLGSSPDHGTGPEHPGVSLQQGQQHRPLLLEEQPLLLQDLLDQERQEQQQQKQMQAMIRQHSNDSFFPSIGNTPVKARLFTLESESRQLTSI